MLATSFADVNRQDYDPADYLAEWKWDGIRVQLASEGKTRRLYSRTGDDISETFPDVLAAFEAEGVIDGELLITTGEVGEDGLLVPAPFSELQKRLNRKTVDRKLMDRAPAFVRAYDLLDEAGTDRRGERFDRRRAHLEAFVERAGSERLDLSPLIAYQTWEELDERRVHPPEPVMEGVMLKRKDSLYVPGRPKGPWFKWKRDPFLIDAVLMYAQRGHGKRSSFYSDYTFGVWRTLEEGTHDLVPVGKAYFGFTDEELKALDSFVRNHTTDRFGPVRQVAMGPDTGLVLEIAFEGLNPSSRHKSGVAMRFPRIHRIRWDKPAGEADTLETVKTFLPERSSAP
jgi:DNA ligase-1